MDTQRLILFLVFSFSLLMLWESWQAKERPSPPAQEQQVSGASQNMSVPVPSAATANVGSSGPTVVPAGMAKGARAVVKTDLFTAAIDANGGDLRDLVLNKYHETEHADEPLQLLEDDQAKPYVAQSGLLGAGPNHKTVYQLGAGSYALAPGTDTISVPLTYIDATRGVSVTRTYTFHRGSYKMDLSTRVVNRGSQPVNMDSYYQLVRDADKPVGEGRFLNTFTGPAIYTDEQKFQKLQFKKITDGSAEYQKNASSGWVGMVQHHFVAAWLPQPGVKREYYAKDLGGGEFSAGVILFNGSVLPGQEKTTAISFYAGPQLQKQLEAASPGLYLTRDYGWLTPLSSPIFWALSKIEKFVGNWGWAIIILTFLIKLALYPLSATSYKSMAQMRKITPRLQKMKEIYGDDRQKLHQAMAELYKKEKINPLGGCLPIVLQIPVFIALYYVLIAAVEMRGAPWVGWIHDLTAPDPFYILPAVMALTSILQVKLNPTPPDPMQAKMMMIMPVVFSVMFMFFPAGLVLYWVTSNILSIAQQWAINKQFDTGAAKA
jgi:YidC/Oxa1 family membrane protein insertase